MFVDQLSCSGDESALLDCHARPLGLAECGSTDVAGVQCTGVCCYYVLPLIFMLCNIIISVT